MSMLLPRARSSGAASRAEEPSLTRPKRVIVFVSKRIRSTRVVFPLAPWPTTARFLMSFVVYAMRQDPRKNIVPGSFAAIAREENDRSAAVEEVRDRRAEAHVTLEHGLREEREEARPEGEEGPEGEVGFARGE